MCVFTVCGWVLCVCACTLYGWVGGVYGCLAHVSVCVYVRNKCGGRERW